MTLNIRGLAASMMALAMWPAAALGESVEALVTPLREPDGALVEAAVPSR
jgi:hypothetical protein